jgi:hypothetical protein
MCEHGSLSGDCVRLSLCTEKQLKLDFLVAANRRAIVEAVESVEDERRRFVAARRKAFVETTELRCFASVV